VSELTLTITEGERRKLLKWANDDYNHFVRTGGGANKTFENKITLISKLKAK
jgi:hypothetical protein